MVKIKITFEDGFYKAVTYNHGEFKAKSLSKLLTKLSKFYKSQEM